MLHLTDDCEKDRKKRWQKRLKSTIALAFVTPTKQTNVIQLLHAYWSAKIKFKLFISRLNFPQKKTLCLSTMHFVHSKFYESRRITWGQYLCAACVVMVRRVYSYLYNSYTRFSRVLARGNLFFLPSLVSSHLNKQMMQYVFIISNLVAVAVVLMCTRCADIEKWI